MKKFNYLVILFLFSLYSLAQVNVSGRVTDESNQPLSGVSISIKGKSGGVTTNSQGMYAITAPDLQSTLLFSFVGYTLQQVPIKW